MQVSQVLEILMSVAVDSAPQMISLSLLGIILCMSIMRRRSTLFQWREGQRNPFVEELDLFIAGKPGHDDPVLKRFRGRLEKELELERQPSRESQALSH